MKRLLCTNQQVHTVHHKGALAIDTMPKTTTNKANNSATNNTSNNQSNNNPKVFSTSSWCTGGSTPSLEHSRQKLCRIS